MSVTVKSGGGENVKPEVSAQKDIITQLREAVAGKGLGGDYDLGYADGKDSNEFFEQFMARSFIEFESDTTYPIRYGMFRSCKDLVSVRCPNSPYTEHESCRYASLLKTIDFESLEEIGPYGFASCFNLETVNTPNLKRLKGNTFNQCTNLKSFPYFEQLEEINGYEFRQCPIEQKVWDFKNLTKIGAQYPLSESSAEVVIFRKAVTQMDRIFHGMPNLRVVDLHTAFPIGRYAFQNSPNFEALLLRDETNIFSIVNVDVLESNVAWYGYVPAVLLEQYKIHTNWAKYPNRLRTLDLERLAWYASGRVLWIDSECNTETGHTEGVTELFDLSKNGHNTTITGTLAYNDGYMFDGNAANYLTVPATPELDNAEELTYEMVWDLANISGTQRLLFSSGLQMYINNSSFKCDLNFDGTPKEQPMIKAQTGLVSLAITFKANNYQKLFMNGVEVVSFDAGTNVASAPIFTVGQGGGSYPAASGNKFLAMRAYNRALTAEEIASNYQLDAGRWGA